MENSANTTPRPPANQAIGSDRCLVCGSGSVLAHLGSTGREREEWSVGWRRRWCETRESHTHAEHHVVWRPLPPQTGMAAILPAPGVT